jgi:hypothetical protein
MGQLVGEVIQQFVDRMNEARRAARRSIWPCDRELQNAMADLYRTKLEFALRRLSSSGELARPCPLNWSHKAPG